MNKLLMYLMSFMLLFTMSCDGSSPTSPDDGGDDTSSPDAGGPGSTDMGFSTSQGGFIPKRKKKKSMKRGGLASRK